MKRAIIAIDMLEDTSSEKQNNPVTLFARAIVPGINRLTDIAWHKKIPIILSMDIFMHGDQYVSKQSALSPLQNHDAGGIPEGAE